MLIYSFRASIQIDLYIFGWFYLGDVGKNYHHYKSMGFLRNWKKSHFYLWDYSPWSKIYRHCCSKWRSRYCPKNILGHEHTIIEKEQEMLKNVSIEKPWLSPFCWVHGDEHISRFIDAHLDQNLPILDMQANYWRKDIEFGHWRVKMISMKSNNFSNNMCQKPIFRWTPQVKSHIRIVKRVFCTTKTIFIPLSGFFSMFKIWPFTILIALELPESMTLLQFIIKCSGIVDIKQIETWKATSKIYHSHLYRTIAACHDFGRVCFGKYTQRPVVLDVDIFNHEILKVFWTSMMSRQPPISYVPGHMGLQPLIDKCKNRENR